MLNLLVSKTDNVTVKVFCWSADGDIEATHVKSEVPKDVEMEEVEFIFRKPGYADSNIIIQNSNLKMEGDDTALNAVSFQNNVLRTLLVDWTLKNEEGQKIAVNTMSLNNLVPNVARSAVNSVLDKIRI